MKCPSCQNEIADPSTGVCPGCGFQLIITNHQKSTPNVRPGKRPKLPIRLDYVVQIDRTGSSKAYARGIPVTYEIILNNIKHKVQDIKCFTGSHGDLDEGMPFVLHSDGVDPETAIHDVKQISYEGGGVPQEHHIDGINEMFDMVPWHQDHYKGRGVFIAIFTADSKPSRSGITAAELGKKIKDKKVLFYIVADGIYPFVHELIREAGGLIVCISNNPDPNELNDLANKVTASIQASIQAGSTIPLLAA